MNKKKKPTKIDQICHYIQSAIESGLYGVADQIPPVRILMKLHDCSRMTVITALKRLQAENLIYVKNGAGAYVCPKTRRHLVLVLSASPASEFFNFGNIAFHQFITGVRQACDKKYLEHKVAHESYDTFLKNLELLDIVYPGLAGVIYFRGHEHIDKINDQLSKKQVPTIFYGSKVNETSSKDNNWLYLDHSKVIQLAVDYLVSQGHSSIGILYYGEHPVHQKLFDYSILAFESAGIPLTEKNQICLSDKYGRDAESRLKSLMSNKNHTEFTALYSISDTITMQSLWALTSMGINCPEHISLLSSENSPYLQVANIGISSISLNIERSGYEAIRLLVEEIPKASKKINQECLVELVERDSVKNINKFLP